jgi:spermidine synthase
MSAKLNKNPRLEGDWVGEVNPRGFALLYRIKEHLFSAQSEFQQVDVVDTPLLGKMLLNDSLVMVTEKDERNYHEMMAHAPLCVHPHPENVLVIGGGDGGTAREVLRHASVKKCVMVEIDELVVKACKEHIPQTAAVFADPRLELIIGDGVEYVKNSREIFDVILVDSTDPIGPATPLFGLDFYRGISARLGPEGIVVAQGESPFYDFAMQETLIKIAAELFPVRGFYNFNNQTYPGGLWSFMFASKGPHPTRDFKSARIPEPTLYYNSEIHPAAFALPQYQKLRLAPWARI